MKRVTNLKLSDIVQQIKVNSKLMDYFNDAVVLGANFYKSTETLELTLQMEKLMPFIKIFLGPALLFIQRGP